MNVLLLPGNSPRHSRWVEELKAALTRHADNIKVQHYQHWQTGEEKANVDDEILVAKQHANTLGEYVIVAKSIGTAIAVKGVADGALHPQKLILLGAPIKGGVPAEQFNKWLKHVSIPVVFVQNTNDPIGSFSDVRAAFQSQGNAVSFIELPGETHDYLDFPAIAKALRETSSGLNNS